MTYASFYDQILTELLVGRFHDGISLLVGMLDGASQDEASVASATTTLRTHDLWSLLKQDPLCAFNDDRGNKSALLADIICNQAASPETGSTGRRLFDVTTGLTFSRALRERRCGTQDKLQRAWQSGQRICVVGHGQFRALEALAGQDLSNVTLVAPDRDVALHLSEKFGATATIVQVQICAFFEQASATASKFDLICATDLPDQSSIDDLRALLCTAQNCLSETGKIQLASFLPDHLGSGWRTVCLNWALHCFQESDLVQLGQAVGLHTSTYRDAANCVAWSEFSKTTNSSSWGAHDYGH